MLETPSSPESAEKPKGTLIAGIVMRDGRFLMVHNVKYGLRIEPSGGKLLPGEAHEAGVAREMYEELLVKVRVIGFIGTYETDMTKEGIFDVHTYLCEIVEGEPTPNEPGKIEGYEWSTPDELEANPAITPSLRATLPDLRALLVRSA